MKQTIYIDNLPEPLIAKSHCLQTTFFYGEKFIKAPDSETYYCLNKNFGIKKIEVEI